MKFKSCPWRRLMSRYESYKPSYIDWVGEIPSHWETVQPKYKLNRVTRPIDNEDEVITCFRDGVVTLRKNRREDGFTNSIKEHGYQQIQPGDLVVHEMDGFAGAIGISDSKGKSTPVYTVVEPDHRTDLRYISYLLREMSQTGKIESLARSIRERTTDFRWNMWSVIPFPFPPVEEQKLISRYLEKKTSQIDSLIEKIQNKIQLIKEQRTSLINHYVTKGLDPNVEMKNSGVDWVGEIPKHWEFTKLKYLVSYNQETLSEVTDPNYEFHYIEIGDVDYIEGIKINEKISFSRSPSRARRIVKPDDVVISTVRTYLRSIGVIPDLNDIVCSTGFCVLRDNTGLLDQNFLSYVVKSEWFVSQVIGNSYGVSYPAINSSELVELKITCPPKNEQSMIAEYLGTQIKQEDRKITLEEKRISLLKEYRQSLISSAVTGKVQITEDMI